MRKLVVLVFALALVTQARATSVTGKMAIGGVNTFTTTSLTFNNPAVVLLATGDFSVLAVPSLINVENAANFASEPGTELFDVTSAGVEITLTIQTFTVESLTANFLNVLGTATLTRTGRDATLYDFSLTSSRPDGTTSFALDVAPPAAPVPEPASLILVGTGLLILALVFRRKGVRMVESSS